MAFVSSGHSSLEMTFGRPLCPRCRAPMWTVRVEPEKTADDDRMFQCPRSCNSYVNRYCAPVFDIFLLRALIDLRQRVNRTVPTLFAMYSTGSLQMSYLIDTADRSTHLKIIIIASLWVTMLMAAALVIH